MTALTQQLAARLAQLRQQGLTRTRTSTETPQQVQLTLAGKPVINFCSNDYLGLANHPAVIAAFKAGADRYGVGSGSAHLICGHSTAHHALEEELAAFTGRDRALLFSTGYMANIGVISALLKSGDAVFEDRLNHASLLDGGLMSCARFQRYAHADVANLKPKLTAATGNRLIVTDGVFSMDGDCAPLPALAAAAHAAQAWLMVDDAHGLGVVGPHGGGLIAHYALSQHDVPVLMGTLGKGFGTFGAFVAGSETLIETLIQTARSYIYTTALPPAVAEATRASLKLLSTEDWRRDHLHALATQFKQGARQLGLQLLETPPDQPCTAIVPIIIGDSSRAVAISKALLADGFWVSAIRPPTVPNGTARLRVTFSAEHQPWQVEQLLAALAKQLKIQPETHSSAPNNAEQ